MFIPELPPKAGYIEAIVDGVHVYHPTEEQLEKEALQQALADTRLQLAQSDEAALDLFEAQAAQDEAILDLYEKTGG